MALQEELNLILQPYLLGNMWWWGKKTVSAPKKLMVQLRHSSSQQIFNKSQQCAKRHCFRSWVYSESESEVSQPCPTFCDPMDCSLPASSVHGILQARTLEWVAISFTWGSSRPRDRTRVSGIAGRRFNLNEYTLRATKQGLSPQRDCIPGEADMQRKKFFNHLQSYNSCLTPQNWEAPPSSLLLPPLRKQTRRALSVLCGKAAQRRQVEILLCQEGNNDRDESWKKSGYSADESCKESQDGQRARCERGGGLWQDDRVGMGRWLMGEEQSEGCGLGCRSSEGRWSVHFGWRPRMAGMKSFVGLSGPKVLKGSGLDGCSAWHKESHDRCYCQQSGAVSRLGQGAKWRPRESALCFLWAWLEGWWWSEISGMMGAHGKWKIPRGLVAAQLCGDIWAATPHTSSARPHHRGWGSLISLRSSACPKWRESVSTSPGVLYSTEILRIYLWAKLLEIKKCASLFFLLWNKKAAV